MQPARLRSSRRGSAAPARRGKRGSRALSKTGKRIRHLQCWEPRDSHRALPDARRRTASDRIGPPKAGGGFHLGQILRRDSRRHTARLAGTGGSRTATERNADSLRRDGRSVERSFPAANGANWPAPSMAAKTGRNGSSRPACLLSTMPRRRRAFERVLEVEPDHLLAGLNRAEALVLAGRKEEAVQQARQTLLNLERSGGLSPDHLDAFHYSAGFGTFRVEWETCCLDERRRPGWRTPRQTKSDPLPSARATRRFDRRPDALSPGGFWPVPTYPMAWPHSAAPWPAKGRFAEALPLLRAAVSGNPFDRAAARALFDVLGDARDLRGRGEFARQQRLLNRAAPQVIPVEDWIKNPPPTGQETYLDHCAGLQPKRSHTPSAWRACFGTPQAITN